MKMKKGQKLTFIELRNTLKSHPDYRWRLWGVGGTFGYLNQARWDWQFETYIDCTDGGDEIFGFESFDDENHLRLTVHYGNFKSLNYEIEVVNENPLRISIMWDDGEDNLLTIWEKI